MVAAGVALSIWTAAQSSKTKPPTFAEVAVLLAGSAALNIAGGAYFGRIGRVQPGHARSAVRRLLRLGGQLASTRTDLIHSMTEISDGSGLPLAAASSSIARMADLAGTIQDAIADWQDVHPEALRSVLESQQTWQRLAEESDQT
jgi:hypothetical protein